MEEVVIVQPLGQEEIFPANEANFPIPFLDLNSILRLEPVADDNDEGSLTPSTKSRKVQLSDVRVSDTNIKEYNEIIPRKRTEMREFFEPEIEKLKIKVESLKKVIALEADDKTKLFQTCIAAIPDLEHRLKISEEKLGSIMDSKSCMGPFKNDNIFSFATIYQQDILNVGQVSEDFPAVLHYGLYRDSQLLKDLIGNYIQNGILHPCEKAIFLEAFKYLHQVESTEHCLKTPVQDRVGYSRNVVLVDIFDRSTNVINEGRNQTHTIALWKNKDDEIVLIDPSKRSYSDHLLESVRAVGKVNVEIFAVPVIYGIASYGQDTGYSSYEEEVPKPRDCVDIAVKIAFELNEQQKLRSSLKQIENNMLEQISNQLNQAKYLNKFEKLVIRELQSSSFDMRTMAKNLLVSLNHFLSAKPPLTKLIRFDKIKYYRDIEELEKACKTLEKFI